MRLLHPDLVEEFYEKVKQDFPDISLKEMDEIVSSPFVSVREGIESGKLPTIRLKYFGTFTVYPKRAEAMKKTYNKMLEESRITPLNHKKKMYKLNTYLNKDEN